MNINIITLFPELIKPFFETGIIKRAIEKSLINVNIINLRDYGIGKHRKVDDYPYGGSSGMILMAEPLKNALPENRGFVVLTSPAGKQYNQDIANQLSKEETLTIIAGRYKAIDERFIQKYVNIEISIGDYILQGGEIPALIIVESVSRLIDGVLGDIDSANTDSFAKGFLDSPKYTRPEEFENMRVPDILLSGHHKKIKEWEHFMSIKRTVERRPDLIKKLHLTEYEKKIINNIDTEEKND